MVFGMLIMGSERAMCTHTFFFDLLDYLADVEERLETNLTPPSCKWMEKECRIIQDSLLQRSSSLLLILSTLVMI